MKVVVTYDVPKDYEPNIDHVWSCEGDAVGVMETIDNVGTDYEVAVVYEDNDERCNHG